MMKKHNRSKRLVNRITLIFIIASIFLISSNAIAKKQVKIDEITADEAMDEMIKEDIEMDGQYSATTREEMQVGEEEADYFSLLDSLNSEIFISTRYNLRESEAPSIVSSISGYEIHNMGARNMEDVLRRIAGVNLTRNSIIPVQDISIRGLKTDINNSVKFMINGMPLKTAKGDAYSIIGNLPIGNVKKIEIIRGPGSALYGSSAMIGVINIITNDQDNYASSSVSYGTFNTIKGNGQANFSIGALKINFFADYTKSDGDDSLIIESDKMSKSPVVGVENSNIPGSAEDKYCSYNLFGRIKYKDFFINSLYSRNKVEPKLSLTIALTPNNKVIYENSFAELGYDGNLLKDTKLIAKVYGNFTKYKFDWWPYNEKGATAITNYYATVFGPYSTSYPDGIGAHGVGHETTSIMGCETTINHEIIEGVNLLLGGQYESTKQEEVKYSTNSQIFSIPPVDVTNGDGMTGTYNLLQYLGGDVDVSDQYPMTDPNAKRKIIAGYGQTTIQVHDLLPITKNIGENLSLTAGVRYDKYDDFGSSTNMRAGLVYSPLDALFFKALYGSAFNAPSFVQLHQANSTASEGNPDLEPETIKTGEGQIGINVTKHIVTTLTYFFTKKPR